MVCKIRDILEISKSKHKILIHKTLILILLFILYWISISKFLYM